MIQMKILDRGEYTMTCYEELKARGLIAQVTNEEEISKMIRCRQPLEAVKPMWQ